MIIPMRKMGISRFLLKILDDNTIIIPDNMYSKIIHINVHVIDLFKVYIEMKYAYFLCVGGGATVLKHNRFIRFGPTDDDELNNKSILCKRRKNEYIGKTIKLHWCETTDKPKKYHLFYDFPKKHYMFTPNTYIIPDIDYEKLPFYNKYELDDDSIYYVPKTALLILSLEHCKHARIRYVNSLVI